MSVARPYPCRCMCSPHSLSAACSDAGNLRSLLLVCCALDLEEKQAYLYGSGPVAQPTGPTEHGAQLLFFHQCRPWLSALGTGSGSLATRRFRVVDRSLGYQLHFAKFASSVPSTSHFVLSHASNTEAKGSSSLYHRNDRPASCEVSCPNVGMHNLLVTKHLTTTLPRPNDSQTHAVPPSVHHTCRRHDNQDSAPGGRLGVTS